MLARMTSRIAALLLVMLLAACAGAPTVAVSAADRAAIKVVNVEPDVPLPPEIFFSGRAQAFAAAGGIIGALAGQEMAKGPKMQLVDTMRVNGISVPEIVKAEFMRAANARPGIRFAEGAAPADAQLSLAVGAYGYGQTQGFSALLYPMMRLTATLKRRDGSIAWQKSDFAVPLNSENNQGYEFEEYMRNPQLLRTTMANIAGIVSRMLVADLQAAR